jgi:hypothetical protein
MDRDREEEALGVDEHVPLAALHLLAAVEAAQAADSRRFDRLAVNAASAGLWIAPQLDAQPLAQNGVQPLPRPIQTPLPEIVVHGLPSRQILRKEAPGAAGAQHVEDGVEDGAQTVPTRATARGTWDGQKRTNHLPLRVAQIGKIDGVRGHTDEHIPARRTLDVLIFRRFLIPLLSCWASRLQEVASGRRPTP